MILHQDIKLLEQSIRATSQHFSIKETFVEKDYWISLVLSRLARSEKSDKIVFKGGTSLSKAYNLIERFSEDVDLAVVRVEDMNPNQIKQLIRSVEKEITADLLEIKDTEVSRKFSRYRKSLFSYHPDNISNKEKRILVEINSFANPYPAQPMNIKSMITAFLEETNRHASIEEYQLQPFTVNVLSKEQTLLEKLISLIRFSFSEDSIAGLSEKIRHFYDLHYLYQDQECKEFMKDPGFKERFGELLHHDKKAFDEPTGWKEKGVSDSPLIKDFASHWVSLKQTYQKELSEYAYRPIPEEKIVSDSFKTLIKHII